MPNRVELIFVGLAFLYMGIIIKREYDVLFLIEE
jgi:hypothetical protein